MKTSAVALAALLGLCSAQNAVVINGCPSAIYVQSFPYKGGAAGQLTTVPPGKFFSEPFRATGSTVKIAKTKTLDKPLFFGYSFSKSGDYAYYEYSTEWGNPFAANHNMLTPGDGCELFNCQANDAGCYSTPAHKKVFGCPQPVNLTAHVCQ
ncbi:hypothetical protein ED733_002791 [Metarhizium rileyi]|uniref:16 kDa allergen n=1 Tax=Metarhizium rileyi (strain RCEF 4871) TaxID=1649241 RepID=A0A5C6G9B3_METRR|nr:hypothetical protein ED733_002791 [Metarhizium rileyi]